MALSWIEYWILWNKSKFESFVSDRISLVRNFFAWLASDIKSHRCRKNVDIRSEQKWSNYPMSSQMNRKMCLEWEIGKLIICTKLYLTERKWIDDNCTTDEVTITRLMRFQNSHRVFEIEKKCKMVLFFKRINIVPQSEFHCSISIAKFCKEIKLVFFLSIKFKLELYLDKMYWKNRRNERIIS